MTQENEREYLTLALSCKASELLNLMSFAQVQGGTGRWQPASMEEFKRTSRDFFLLLNRFGQSFDIPFDKPKAFAIDFLERKGVKSRNPKADIDMICVVCGEFCGIQAMILKRYSGVWQPEYIERVEPKLNLILMNLIRVLHTYGTNLETVMEMSNKFMEGVA